MYQFLNVLDIAFVVENRYNFMVCVCACVDAFDVVALTLSILSETQARHH